MEFRKTREREGADRMAQLAQNLFAERQSNGAESRPARYFESESGQETDAEISRPE